MRENAELRARVKAYHLEGTKDDHNQEDHGNWADGEQVDLSNLKTLPKEIDGFPIIKKPLPGGMLAIGSANGIAVSTSKRAAVAWKNMAEYQKKAFESGWSSSSHPNHVIWHELAHAKVKRDNPDRDHFLKNLKPLFDSVFKDKASRVSRYAATNGHEFVAEVYAARRAGRKLDDDILDYYKYLKGPE